MKTQAFIILCIMFLGACSSIETGDYYTVTESGRSFAGRSSNMRIQYWFNEEAFAIQYGDDKSYVFIHRDSSHEYTVVPGTKKYYEKPIREKSAGQSNTDNVDFKYLFQNRYSPEYDWIIGKNIRKDTINAFKCILTQARGEADFGSVRSDYWFNISKHKEGAQLFIDYLIKDWESSKVRKSLVMLLKRKGNALPIRIIEEVVGPISTPMTYNFEIHKFEQKSAPEGMLEIPSDFVKGN